MSWHLSISTSRHLDIGSPGRLLLGLPLQLVVGHGDDGEDEVDEIEAAQEDVEDEEEHVVGAGSHQGDLIQVLPVVLKLRVFFLTVHFLSGFLYYEFP